ncbi:hypothetical protein [Phytohabitans rumicis]|nr:hypothetical protein [Phytohabitans rumicis]
MKSPVCADTCHVADGASGVAVGVPAPSFVVASGSWSPDRALLVA